MKGLPVDQEIPASAAAHLDADDARETFDARRAGCLPCSMHVERADNQGRNGERGSENPLDRGQRLAGDSVQNRGQRQTDQERTQQFLSRVVKSGRR